MNQQEFDDLLKRSLAYLDEQQRICNMKYKLNTCNRMEYEQETGEMIFSALGVPKVITIFQVVGSVSEKSNTWLWSWDNPYLLDKVNEEIWKVKEYGEKNDISKLKEAKWEAGDQDGWDMTAIAAYVLKAKGAYRFPSDEIMTYVVFTSIRQVGNQYIISP